MSFIQVSCKCQSSYCILSFEITHTEIFILIIFLASYEYVGCFKDRPDRALPIKLITASNSLETCMEIAMNLGYTVFGIQNGNECWSGSNAQSTYNKYGPSTACRDGMGAPWTNDVYKIHIGKRLFSFGNISLTN